MYKYNITLNDDDYLQFNQYSLLNSRSGKRVLMRYRLLAPLLYFSIIVITLTDADFYTILSETITMAILSIIWIVVCKRVLLLSSKMSIKRKRKEGELPYNREAKLIFDDEYIYDITPDSETRRKYSSIEKVCEAEKAIYIYINSSRGYILPLTAFSEEAEKQKFLQFLNLKVYTSKTQNEHKQLNLN